MRFLILLLSSLLSSDALFAAGRDLSVSVLNPGAFERAGETIAVPWVDLLTYDPGLDPRTVAVFDGIVEIPSQVVQADADGSPEHLLFQADFTAHERRAFIVRNTPVRTVFPSLVDARFVLPREDLAWENDHVAFRIYGPALAAEVNNGIDVWTKRVRSLIVQKWYKESEGSTPGKDSYHVDKGEGADFFSVGKSLGAGACALWEDGTLFQPGVFSSYRIQAKGPIRAIFQAVYHNGGFHGNPFRAVATVSIDAGQNLNRIDIEYSGITGRDSLTYAAGLVARKGTSVHRDEKEGWVSLWGPVNDDPVNESLGTGIVIPLGTFAGFAEDGQHVLALGRTRTGFRSTYYAGAAWTRSGDVAGPDDWNRQLAAWAQRMQEPLIVTLKTDIR